MFRLLKTGTIEEINAKCEGYENVGFFVVSVAAYNYNSITRDGICNWIITLEH